MQSGILSFKIFQESLRVGISFKCQEENYIHILYIVPIKNCTICIRGPFKILLKKVFLMHFSFCSRYSYYFWLDIILLCLGWLL